MTIYAQVTNEKLTPGPAANCHGCDAQKDKAGDRCRVCGDYRDKEAR